MKILWLCSRMMRDADQGETGTWLDAMARGLMADGGVELGVIATGQVSFMQRCDYRAIRQWLVPDRATRAGGGLPGAAIQRQLLEVCRGFDPDLVHVWGTEGYWGLLSMGQRLGRPVLLELQGLKATMVEDFCGGLSVYERLQCIGGKELIKCSTLGTQRRAFQRWERREREMIQGHHYIAVQSPWVAAHTRSIHPQAQLFETDLALRAAFDAAAPWQPVAQPVLFTSSAYPLPFKGLHVAIRALAVLRRRLPGARLRIAGGHQRPGLRLDGYVRWMNALIRQEGLAGHVDWLGALSGDQVVRELQAASAAIIPSFVESYCVAMAEAMRVGTPTVASYTGGTGYLGSEEETCLFFAPGDAAMCAYQAERLWNDSALAARLSRQARETAAVRHNRATLIRQQIDTYRRIVAMPGAAAGPGVAP